MPILPFLRDFCNQQRWFSPGQVKRSDTPQLFTEVLAMNAVASIWANYMPSRYFLARSTTFGSLLVRPTLSSKGPKRSMFG
jgi:hypothetical protein